VCMAPTLPIATISFQPWRYFFKNYNDLSTVYDHEKEIQQLIQLSIAHL
jgi:hypothetical protein